MIGCVFLLSDDEVEKCDQADGDNQGDQEESDDGHCDHGKVHTSAWEYYPELKTEYNVTNYLLII